jgi:hypothetical protein
MLCGARATEIAVSDHVRQGFFEGGSSEAHACLHSNGVAVKAELRPDPAFALSRELRIR